MPVVRTTQIGVTDVKNLSDLLVIHSLPPTTSRERESVGIDPADKFGLYQKQNMQIPCGIALHSGSEGSRTKPILVMDNMFVSPPNSYVAVQCHGIREETFGR